MIGFILRSLIIGLRPLFGPAACRFEQTCTPYAVEQLKTQPLWTALWNICKRLASCHPFAKLDS